MEDSSFSDKAEEPLIYGLRDSTTIRLSATGQSKPQHFLAYKDIFFTLLFLGNLLFVGAIAISYGGVAMASAGADYWIVDLNGHEALDKATHHITSKLMMGVLLALTIGGVLSMSWIYFLSKVASFVMNTMIMSIVGICAIGGVFVLGMGYPYLGFLLILVALLTLILSLVFQARIEFASMNLKVACEGIVAIPTTISYSLKMLFLQAIFVTIWCIATYGFATNAYKVSKSFGGHTYNLDECTSYKYSTAFEVDGLSLTCASTTGSPCYACLCGDDNELISTNACFKPRFYWTAMVFLVLSLFWATAVIANVVHCTTAAAISHWWRQGKCDDDTVAEGFRRVTSYSFGSICFGSLLAAIIRTIRSILVFLNGKMRRREEYRQSSTMMERMNSCAARVLMNLLHILDRMIVYFNRYAFVFVAIEGQDYMQASSTAVQLFKSRGFATLLNDDIIDLLIHISTVMIGLLTMILAYMYCKAVVLSHAYSYLLAIFSFFCGYVMSTVLLSTMSSAVTTVYVSFAKNPREFEVSNLLHASFYFIKLMNDV